MSLARSLAVIGLFGVVAACTTTPPPAPVLSYSNLGCMVTPDLATALSMTPDKERAVHHVSAVVNETTTCLMRKGIAVPYVVLTLPEDHNDKTVIVGSQLDVNRIFAPEIEVLDAQGKPTRSFSREEYFYRGTVYSVQFRPRPQERYVLVAAAPELVGQRYDAIQIGVNSSVVSTGLVTATYSFGAEAATSRLFAYNGTVNVIVNDTDTEEAK